MRCAHLLLLCLVLAPACDDAASVPDPLPEPEKHTRSVLVSCTDQPQLGDTWELDIQPRHIQLDAEGNIYVDGASRPDCVPQGSFKGSFGLLTKIGPRGDVRWVRGWEDSWITAAVSPSGEVMVLAGENEVFLIDDDGAIKEERRGADGVFAVGATSTSFLLAGSRYGREPVAFDDQAFASLGDYSLFVLSLDGDLALQTLHQSVPSYLDERSPTAVLGLSNGDVVMTHVKPSTEPYQHDTEVIRAGARPWTATMRGEGRIFALADDSLIFQAGGAISRLSSDGELLWSRDYRGSLHVLEGQPLRSKVRGVAMQAAASPNGIAVAFVADPLLGPLETSAGPSSPDGQDIGFATIDIESGLIENLTLETAPGDQYIVDPVLHDDGWLVARIGTRLPKELEKSGVARFRLP